MERDAFGLHLLDPAVDVPLLKLEIGNPVAQETAGFAVLLVDMNVMASTRELLGASETRGTGTHNRDLLVRFMSRRLRFDPAFRICAVDNRAFDGLDRDRRVLDVQSTGRFARRRTYTPGDFREVVGREQIARGFGPVAPVCKVVPVRDLVVDRTADVTIGDAAIHAARRLIARSLLTQRQHKLAIVADSVGGRRITPVRAIDL